MPGKERGGAGQPGRRPEQEPLYNPFLYASRFDSKKTSQAPYDTIQEIVRTQDVDLSVFRLIQNWPESMSKDPPSEKKWYVVALGIAPSEPLLQRVRDAIERGEVVDLPDEVVEEMARRRAKETAKRPYSEIHRQPHIIRRSEQKKKKMQKDSRRRNRGK